MISSSLLYVFQLILLKLIKLPQSLIVEVDQVFCFSTLHYQVIYSKNFYMVSELADLQRNFYMVLELADLQRNFYMVLELAYL